MVLRALRGGCHRFGSSIKLRYVSLSDSSDVKYSSPVLGYYPGWAENVFAVFGKKLFAVFGKTFFAVFAEKILAVFGKIILKKFFAVFAKTFFAVFEEKFCRFC